MPFDRPTLTELVTRVEADLQGRLGVGPFLARGVLKAIARVLAGSAHLQHGHLDWASRQVIPSTAESAQLDRWASFWGLSRKAAAFAAGNVTFTGADGKTIPAGALLRRADGTEYTTDALATIASGTATVAATAEVAAAAGNAAAGVIVSLVSPIAGVDTNATVAAGGLTSGADEETDAALRARLELHVQDPPQGGSLPDYVRWALEISGVTRAWAFEEYLGLGTVGLTFAVDANDPPIPGASKVAEVQAYIDGPPMLRPVTADLTVYAPTEVQLDPTITLTVEDGHDVTTVQAAVSAALTDLIKRDAVPGGTLYVSRIREAIANTPGEKDHVLTSPAADVVYTNAQLGTLGTVTWA